MAQSRKTKAGARTGVAGTVPMTDSGISGTGVCGAEAPGQLAPILLVEDEIFIRIASADWLRDAGYAVIEAASPAEALDVLASRQDLALLATDITMPGPLTGLDLAAHSRAAFPDMPVILLSAHVPADHARHADGALMKPFSPMELVRLVEATIGKPWQTRIPGARANKAC